VKNAYSAKKLIQSSELEIVEGMGHMLDEESYEKFKFRFIEFLNK
jgi:pimeloyl-ACP methyl ester carboxylesterase